MKLNVGKAILNLNDEQSLHNRRQLDALKLVAVNVLASPGAGKTTTLTQLLRHLTAGGYAAGVIEGDVAGSLDTDKLLAMGFAATQINTDGGCHLDAAMVRTALDRLAIRGPGYVFIENIGNLICPTQFHLGESLRLVLASVPEGDDKPVKYPGVFQTADLVVLNKIDLLGHVDFRMDFFESAVRAVNPAAPIFHASARKGEGFEPILQWLATHADPRRM